MIADCAFHVAAVTAPGMRDTQKCWSKTKGYSAKQIINTRNCDQTQHTSNRCVILYAISSKLSVWWPDNKPQIY